MSKQNLSTLFPFLFFFLVFVFYFLLYAYLCSQNIVEPKNEKKTVIITYSKKNLFGPFISCYVSLSYCHIWH